MQAIQTKFIGPTNTRGDRIKATCAAGSLTVSWDFSLDQDANHKAAAEALRTKMGWQWYGQLESGTLKDGSFVHVIVPKR